MKKTPAPGSSNCPTCRSARIPTTSHHKASPPYSSVSIFGERRIRAAQWRPATDRPTSGRLYLEATAANGSSMRRWWRPEFPSERRFSLLRPRRSRSGRPVVCRARVLPPQVKPLKDNTSPVQAVGSLACAEPPDGSNLPIRLRSVLLPQQINERTRLRQRKSARGPHGINLAVGVKAPVLQQLNQSTGLQVFADIPD